LAIRKKIRIDVADVLRYLEIDPEKRRRIADSLNKSSAVKRRKQTERIEPPANPPAAAQQKHQTFS
jgi:hypothetical protein